MTAYTGVNMMIGGEFSYFYRYASEKLGREVYTHEMATLEFWDDLKEASRSDFEKICGEAAYDEHGV